MEVSRLLTPYNYSAGSADRIRYIVIHYVGATGGAKANCEYYASQYVGASAHYFVGFEGEIWQSVEDKNVAWHCGAKSYRHPECRNSNSIGIELCVRNRGSQSATSRDWYFEDATVEAAAALTRELMKRYGVPTDHVVRHYDVTGKICPNPYVYNESGHTWEEFKRKLKETPEIPDTPDAEAAGWQKQEIVCAYLYRYRKEDGSDAANAWMLINHHWYLFGADGIMKTGWQKWNGKEAVDGDATGDWNFLDNTPGGPLEGACWHSLENGSQEIWYVEE